MFAPLYGGCAVTVEKIWKGIKMIDENQKKRFLKICEAVLSTDRAEMGIGTYGEKYMHRILKQFFCEDTDWHEVGQGAFFADAVVDGVIYEIQTGGYYPLKKKLAYYLSSTDKEIVIATPIVARKRLFWVEPETGNALPPRTVSMRTERTRILREMYWLCELLDFSRIRFCFPIVSVDEYRKLDGYGADKKKKATKIEKIPRELLDIEWITCPKDVVRALIPCGLPDRFVAKDLSRLIGARRRGLSACLGALERLGLIERDGKEGNAVAYRTRSDS